LRSRVHDAQHHAPPVATFQGWKEKAAGFARPACASHATGKIQEIQAVLVARPDAKPTGWDTKWFGPGPGGWKNLPTGQ